MVILFRSPLEHANSLLNQHKKFCKIQKKDPFILEYMNWLGHHEFGLNQKQFSFNKEKKIIECDKFSLNYWLKIWINYYSYVLNISHPNTIFIDYKDYCNQPYSVIEHICGQCEINLEKIKIKAYIKQDNVNRKYDQSIYNDANIIHKYLIKKKIILN